MFLYHVLLFLLVIIMCLFLWWHKWWMVKVFVKCLKTLSHLMLDGRWWCFWHPKYLDAPSHVWLFLIHVATCICVNHYFCWYLVHRHFDDTDAMFCFKAMLMEFMVVGWVEFIDYVGWWVGECFTCIEMVVLSMDFNIIMLVSLC